jgi:uncharacterized BrkB/YihY/UPF0761 family membrane protein
MRSPPARCRPCAACEPAVVPEQPKYWSTARRSAHAARESAVRTLERAHDKRGFREAFESFEWEQRSGAGLLAGGLAYRFFLWLVPFGLVVAAIASFWVRLDRGGLQDAARSFGLGGVAAHSATSAVQDGSRARWFLLIAGLVLLLWAGIGAVRALRVAARLAWGLDPARLRNPLRSSLVFSVAAVLGLAASMFASWARYHLDVLGLVITLLDAVVFGLLALFAFHNLPRPQHIAWRRQWPGAALVGAGVTGVHVFLAYYLAGRLESTPALYGTLGAAVVVLLVLYLIARLVVSAMFLNATLERLRLDGETSGP